MIELTQIACSDPLKMQFFKGISDKLVVVFSGVGGNHREHPPIEFFTAATQDRRNNVLFISDRSRSWLNYPGLDAEIVAKIRSAIAENGISNLSMLGNSMGASMALLLAPKLPTNTVIALTPQYSVHPDIVPEETRWLRFRNRIKDYKYPEIKIQPKQNENIYIVHGSSFGELIHARKFSEIAGIRHFILPGEGHSFASALKQRNVLSPLVSAAITGRPFLFRKIIEQSGGMWSNKYWSIDERE